MSKALAVFHACTGCDTVLYFTEGDKKTAVTVWKNLPAVTDIHPTKKVGPFTAHKQGCLSSWSLLGPSAFTKPNSTFTRELEMDF